MKAQVKPRINLEDRTPLESVIPLATPFVLFVDPSSACNFECVFCPTAYRELIKGTGRFVGAMKLDLFKKIIDDLAEFDRPIRVLRMYKDGEPFLNKKLPDMVAYAKQSGRVQYIDTTTNGSLISPFYLGPVLMAGIDRINISVDGMDNAAYAKFTGAKFDFDSFVENVKWLYANRGNCEVVIKTLHELIPEQATKFYDTFGNYCDRIFVENFAPCWPDFDIEGLTGAKITWGLYGNEVQEVDVCAYIFYSMAINADGLVSSCFQDWQRKLLIGDARTQSVKSIWNSDAMNKLRLEHLEKKRRQLPVCGNCGQLTHCMPSNIDAHREVLLERFKSSLVSA